MAFETMDDASAISLEDADRSFPVRFGLRHVFYATALIALCFSLSFWLVLPAAIWFGICAAAASAATPTERFKRLLSYGALAFLGYCCIGGGILLPTSRQPAAIRTQCATNLRQLSLAMLNYESSWMHFPAASETDAEGKPLHSWRVKILPFIEQQKLYDQYDFTQPWDSPNNLKLLDQMPDVFRCPFSNETNRTNYQLVVGPGSLFDGQVSATFGSLADGCSTTIAIVEDAANPVPWIQPADLSIEQAVEALKPATPEDFPHVYESTFSTTFSPGNFARFDGSIDYGDCCCELERSEVRKMLGIDDGVAEQILDTDYITHKSVAKIAPWFALAFFLLLMLYPTCWVFRKDSLSEPELSS